MTKFFVGNCTKQDYDLHYRLPEERAPLHIIIPSGSQRELPKVDNAAAVVAVTEFIRKAIGAVSVKELPRHRPFVGLVYSEDSSIKVDKIIAGLNHNDDVLVERGHEIRATAAVALNQSIARNLRESQMPETLAEFEVTATEVDSRGKHVTGGLLEGALVTENADPSRAKRQKTPFKGQRR